MTNLGHTASCLRKVALVALTKGDHIVKVLVCGRQRGLYGVNPSQELLLPMVWLACCDLV